MNYNRIEYFPGKDGKWYVRVRGRNGRIVLTGSESFASKGNAKRKAFATQFAMDGAVILGVEK